MAEEGTIASSTQRRGTRGLTGAIILIGIGVALLLQNMGVLSINWFSLWRFWPVFLILVGLDLLLGRTALGSVVTALVGLAVVGTIIFWFGTRAPGTFALSGHTVTRDIQQDLGSANALAVTMNLGAYSANITASDTGSSALQGTYRTDVNLPLDVTYDVSGGTGHLTISQLDSQSTNLPFGGNFVGDMSVNLTNSVPVDLTINAGVGDLTLDLSGLNLRSLVVDGGVGSVRLTLPGQGDYPVTIKSGVGDVRINVPSGMDARITASTGLSGVDVASRFVKQGEQVWASSGYDGASNRATISIDTGIGSVDVNG